MNEPISIPEPTGFAANLERDRQKNIKDLAEKGDMNASPTKLANLGWMNSIVQFSAIVSLLGRIVTELEEARAGKTPEIWCDANGIYYRLIVENGASYTYLPNGEDHTPVEPSRPVMEGSIFGGFNLIPAVSEPRYTRRVGEEQLEIEAGATRISISVLAGEITCSNGDGAIPAGVAPLVFVSDSGLSGLIINGDRDADYIVCTQYPVVDKIEETPEPEVDSELGGSPAQQPAPVIEESDIIIIPDLDLTGDLLPAAGADLIQV